MSLGGRADPCPRAIAEDMARRIPVCRMALFDGGHLFAFGPERERLVTETAAFLEEPRPEGRRIVEG